MRWRPTDKRCSLATNTRPKRHATLPFSISRACDWKLHDEREQELTRLVEEHLHNEGLEDLAPLTLNYFGIPVELRREVAEHRAILAEKAVEVSRKRLRFLAHEIGPRATTHRVCFA